jgi:hypothetical protein
MDENSGLSCCPIPFPVFSEGVLYVDVLCPVSVGSRGNPRYKH